MTALPPPEKVRLQKDTKRLMLRRRMWRRRALESALQLATWPTGKPEREKCEDEVIKSLNKIREWFREPRAQLVAGAIQRRAVNAFRGQFTKSK